MLIIRFTYLIPFKDTNTLINKYYKRNYKSTTVKQTNSRVMFLRSPKHFKTGKQFIHFFNIKRTNTYRLTGSCFWLLFQANNISLKFLYQFFKNYNYQILQNEINIKKISITTTIQLKF